MFTFLPIVYREIKFSEINKRTGTFIREIRVLNETFSCDLQIPWRKGNSVGDIETESN